MFTSTICHKELLGISLEDISSLVFDFCVAEEPKSPAGIRSSACNEISSTAESDLIKITLESKDLHGEVLDIQKEAAV